MPNPPDREFLPQSEADLYLRVSSVLQEEDGTSLQTQEEQCRAYALARGYRVHVSYGILTEGSGGRRFVVAMFEHAYTCGSYGCTILFLMQRSGRWRFAGDGGGDGISFAGESARGGRNA